MKMIKPCLLTLLLAVTFTACNGDQSSGPEETTPSTATAPAAAPPKEAEPPSPADDNIRYTWVDQLNVRDQPNTNGKVVARVKPNEPLTPTGETSPEPETIVLRGVAYDEPWYRITTADGKNGWVFGGAIKAKDEIKGNAVRSPTRIDFPVFGEYDLTKWLKTKAAMTENGGDAEIKTSVYTSDNQELTVTKISTGEYGYSRIYRLTDGSGNLLKERRFSFSTDPNMITEEVVDHTDIPAKRYTRMQKIDKHFMQLNDLPLMARGEWKTERVD